MNIKLASLILILFVLVPPAFGQLDLEQEVLIIPDTHDTKPYIWNVIRNPRGFELVMENSVSSPGLNDQFSFVVKREASIKIEDVHVFITDEDLHIYAHVLPTRKTDGAYSFDFKPPLTAKYRFEVVFRTDRGWVNLRKDIKLKKVDGAEPDAKPGDEDYAVRIKPFPRKIYAEHVGTFLYEISIKGKPLKDLEKIDGFDMQVTAWGEDLKDFIYMTPKQNLGGPEVAVSMVFMRPGRHAIFAEFKHNGYVRRVETVIDVLAEPRIDEHSIENIKPSE